MNIGKAIFIAVAAVGLIAWQGEKVPAQEVQGTPEPSKQTQVPGQAPAADRMRKGYPGYHLRKLDENQTMPKEQKNRITQILADERQQLKALSVNRVMSIEQKKEKARQIREDAHNQIKALLPPAEQKRYEKSQENDRKFREAMRKKLPREAQH